MVATVATASRSVNSQRRWSSHLSMTRRSSAVNASCMSELLPLQIDALVHSGEEVLVELRIVDGLDAEDAPAIVEDLALEAGPDPGLFPEFGDVAGDILDLQLAVGGRSLHAVDDQSRTGDEFAGVGLAAPRGQVCLLGGRDQAEIDHRVLHDVAVVLQHVEHGL